MQKMFKLLFHTDFNSFKNLSNNEINQNLFDKCEISQNYTNENPIVPMRTFETHPCFLGSIWKLQSRRAPLIK